MSFFHKKMYGQNICVKLQYVQAGKIEKQVNLTNSSIHVQFMYIFCFSAVVVVIVVIKIYQLPRQSRFSFLMPIIICFKFERN